MKSEYPLNVIKAMSESDESVFPVSQYITDDVSLGVQYALSLLKARERMIIELRYKDGQTLNQIGEIFEITSERVCQIEKSVFARLRRPDLWKYIELGLQRAIEQDKKMAYDQGFSKGFAAGRANSLRVSCSGQISKEDEEYPAELLALSIDHLDLSPRASRCLKQKGYDTIGAVVKMNCDQIRQMRNFGVQSRMSVSNALRKCNINHTDWEFCHRRG